MHIIVGLGNPGREYEGTRHNVGFQVIDAIAWKYNIEVNTKKHRAFIGKGIIGGHKVILAKPWTYMNLSGESIRSLVEYYKIDSKIELFVIYDDVSLDVGKLRIRGRGSAGGHNGVKSIISCLGEETFPRMKVGVGNKPPRLDLADYVLGQFTRKEKQILEEGLSEGIQAIELYLEAGLQVAMNGFNGKKKEE